MTQEIFVPRTQSERENIVALAEYLDSIFYC
ncbi:hypothetical protein Q666_00255 [Marinobacter sp. ES-1]|jgi:hypothetical protein|nr:hypothetical protein Q666_00255 [Marinobacter sp. ES-1]